MRFEYERMQQAAVSGYTGMQLVFHLTGSGSPLSVFYKPGKRHIVL